MKIDKAIVDKSLAALAESIVSIVADQSVDQAVAMTETFEQFGDYLKSNVVADDDTPLNLSLRNAARAFHDRRRRIAEQLMADEEAERAKKPPTPKGKPMTQSEKMIEMHKFIKSAPNGFASVAKQIVDKGSTSLSEHNFIELWKADAAAHKEAKELDAQAFAREFGGERNARHEAYDICHAAALGYPV